MIIVTLIKIINGNNNPCLMERKIHKEFTDIKQITAWKERVKAISKRRYHKEVVNVDLMFTEKN